LIACFLRGHLIRTAVELLQSLALHLQFHLRILLEGLRVSLAKHLGYPLVRYPSETRGNECLITTRGGHEISLSLVSQGKSDRSELVDYVLLYCERPRSFLIATTHPIFVVGETENVITESQPASTPQEKIGSPKQDLFRTERIENPHWEGKQLQVAVGQALEKEQQMAVPFAVLNFSANPPVSFLVVGCYESHSVGVVTARLARE